MAKDFLLEIGTEEIPAKFFPAALTQLEEQARKKFAELRLEYENIQVYSTPRRLALLVEALSEKQEDFRAEVKGPAVKAAYDAAGNPTKAAQGFAKGQRVEPEDLFVQDVNGIPYVFARKSEAGQPAAEVLPQLCADLIAGLHFPKPMRWGDMDFRFARPIRWLVALFGSEIIPFQFAGLESGRVSRGHRTLSAGTVELAGAGDYLESLGKSFVMADPEIRRKVIRGQIRILAEQAGGEVKEDEDLLNEVTHLVEYPTALIGKVAERYMHLPEAVITTPMREHQRYFPVRTAGGKLLPYFITVRNGNDHALDIVTRGNEKVLKARLEDAAFYYREDQKMPLADLVPKLEKVVYHEKLGTVRARVERLRALSRFIAEKLGIEKEGRDNIDRVAFLAKVDLVTLMVYDFPELQGIMGADYAGSSGEKPEICQGIVEHYQPRFSGDVLPASLAGKVVSVADKLDAITGAFGIGIQPTGSQDPYALRRQAQGIVGIILEAGWDISLNDLIEQAYEGFQNQGVQLLALPELLPALQEFFRQRLRFALQEQGLRHDTVDAVLAQSGQSFYRMAEKARALARKREEKGFAAYAQAFVRCLNLTKKEKLSALAVRRLEDPAEIALAEAIGLRRERFDNLIGAGYYEQAYLLAAELIPLIDTLFQAVMIMADDMELKNARLALLGQCVEVLGCLGDLSLLV